MICISMCPLGVPELDHSGRNGWVIGCSIGGFWPTEEAYVRSLFVMSSPAIEVVTATQTSATAEACNASKACTALKPCEAIHMQCSVGLVHYAGPLTGPLPTKSQIWREQRL